MRIEQVMMLSVAAVFVCLAVGEERPPFPENPTPPGLVGVPEYSPGPNVDPKESRYWKMSKDVVTYDSRSDHYTFWYSHASERYSTTFELGSRVEVHVKTEVSHDGSGEYTYHYTLVHRQGSPQAAKNFIFKIPEQNVREVELPDGWHSIYDSGGSQFMGRIFGKPWRLEPGKQLTFRISSSIPPGYAKLSVRGEAESPHLVVPERAPDYLAFRYEHNSVGGVVIGPSGESFGKPIPALHELADTAKVYGWLPSGTLQEFRSKLSAYGKQDEPDTLEGLLAALKQIAGPQATEVQAVLSELSK